MLPRSEQYFQIFAHQLGQFSLSSAWNKPKNIKHVCVKVEIGVLLEFSKGKVVPLQA
jgi:hypothetical protein